MTDNEIRMNELLDLTCYQTDKDEYFDTYEKLFSKTKVSLKNILNISHQSNENICSSDSYLFSKYFKNAYIFTITPSSKDDLREEVISEKRIRIIPNCNDFNPIIVDSFTNTGLFFDLIVCNGKNSIEEMMMEIRNYPKLLSQNGVLIMENLNSKKIESLLSQIPDEFEKYINICLNSSLLIIDKREEKIVTNLFEKICRKCNVVCHSSDLHLTDIHIPLVISYENDVLQNSNAQMFKQTLENNGWEYMFIGEGIKWSGFRDRIILYEQITKYFPREKIIILSDARDVLCCRSPESFINKIKNIVEKNKIIISTELFLCGHMNWTKDEIQIKNSTFFWQGIPVDNYWAQHEQIPSRQYINAGLIVGMSSNVNKLFSWVKENNYDDDQLGIANYVNNFVSDIYLDHKAEIFHTTTSLVNGGIYDIKIQKEDSPTISELLGYSSYFLHIPGMSGSKGQGETYFICSNILRHYNSNTILNIYNISKTDEYEPKYSFLK